MSESSRNPLGQLARRPRLTGLIISALDETWASFRRTLERVPLQLWDESSFRHHFIQSVLKLRANARMQTEWHTFDLLIQVAQENALIEFKFYLVSWHHNLDGTRSKKAKGGPSPGNVDNFFRCARRLTDSLKKIKNETPDDIHGRFLVLVYADSPDWTRQGYGNSYGDISRLVDPSDVHVLVLHELPPLCCHSGKDAIKATLLLIADEPIELADLESLDRTAFEIGDLATEGDDRLTFARLTPSERILSIEELRRRAYGDEATAGFQRILEIVDFPPR